MKKLIVSIVLAGFTNVMFAYIGYNHHSPVPADGSDDRAAGCAPANEKLFMQFNNVRALIETGGSMWQDRSNSKPSYEIPKGQEKHVLYSGALWMGGEDVNGQLKLAAHTFRQGNDFWPGPLGQLIAGSGNFDPSVPQNADVILLRDFGAADIIPGQCSKYDEFFTMRKAEVRQFITWWECENGITDPEDCADVVRPDQEIMNRIENWPAHGEPSLGEDFYLAPFYDNAKPGELPNGVYDPIIDGDYPWYDLNEEIDCRNDRRIVLFGDETNWWVFNDKGNIHTETGGDPIGMEIRAQAFTFATDDAINDMTFYNYELINRGTQTLFNTYFGQWADPDVGGSNDDYVGCDVTRGLGFAYNSDAFDEDGTNGIPGYGANPPAVGIDFFEGPYQDNDNFDNPKGIGPNMALNGIGYGDGIADNERYGMRRFVYYNIGGGANGDPNSATQYYGYLKGIWQNGSPMLYGGNGFNTGTTTVPTYFMYPGESDPLNWGTNGVAAGPIWTESTAGIAAGDRRFLQSAGPFVLKPGAVNNITVGVVYGRSTDNDLEASVRALKTADSKAQALFDNCFALVEPPVAPLLTIQEMENQLILYLSDPPGYDDLETYYERDRINIITPDELASQGIFYNDTFWFEGYQIYQMKDEFASISELNNLDKARLVAQCDLKNGISRLINYTYDEQLGITIPQVMVDGADEGIRHSFLVTEDLFALGDKKLVNHKKYYYIAVAYAQNEFKEYDPNDPLLLDGQKLPYMRSRISGTGQGIESVMGIPHDPRPEADGTVYTTTYGYQPEITQIEGLGNGGTFLELSDETHDQILASANHKVVHPTYRSGSGPIDVKVIDPLNLKAGVYTIGFTNTLPANKINDEKWWIERYDEVTGSKDTVFSDYLLSLTNEQLILDWGISVTVDQKYYTGGVTTKFTDPIDATITFKDSSKIWLDGIPDGDSNYPTNWIRSGSNAVPDTPDPTCSGDQWIYNPCFYYDSKDFDVENSHYEKLLGGTIAPFALVGKNVYGMPVGSPGYNYSGGAGWFVSLGTAQLKSGFEELHDVDIYITSDKTKWTRCPVLEMGDQKTQTEHNDDYLAPRSDLSVNTEGEPDGTGTGKGWFPGYAIDVNTGARLNMAFGENSWLNGDNGRDMIWNPTSSFADNVGIPLFGGMHYVYVFGENVDGSGCPNYDEGNWLYQKFDPTLPNGTKNSNYRDAWKNCMWVFEPLLVQDAELLATDVKISPRINKPYVNRLVGGENNARPYYQFRITQPTVTMNSDQLKSVLDRINVVPNPYYAYSSYETSKLDNRVKITNLPERCSITIFNMQGALVRSYKKDDPITSLDWDLKNATGIPIAGGVYLIHIKVPIVDASGNLLSEEEKILKWYGVLRQPDLDNL